MSKEKQIDYKEFARQMRQVATVFNGTEPAVVCSKELWESIASTIESFAGYRKQSEGEWLPSPDGINPIRCNKCNMPAPFAAGENEFGDFEICRYPSNYCPHCGAKMKGGEE